MNTPSFCKLDFCASAAEEIDWPCDTKAKCFCSTHNAAFLASPQGIRAMEWASVGLQREVVSMLFDFRTVAELEHRRDRDPQVTEARRGSCAHRFVTVKATFPVGAGVPAMAPICADCGAEVCK